MDKKINKDNVIKEIRDIIEKDSVVLFAYLHGSFLENSSYHDIDVAIYLKEAPRFLIDDGKEGM